MGDTVTVTNAKGEQHTKKELEIFDASMQPRQTVRIITYIPHKTNYNLILTQVKLTLWNEDIQLLKDLPIEKFYYKITIQEASTNIYLQETSVLLRAAQFR